MPRFSVAGDRTMRPSRFVPIAALSGMLALLSAFPSVACAQTPQAEPPGETSIHFDSKARLGKKDILGVLKDDGHFETLLKALNVAGLTMFLKGKAPLTMFAPTDEAFAKLPAGMLDKWLKDPKILKQALRYHIIKAYVPSKQMVRLRNALMANGLTARFDVTTGEGGMSTIVINWEIAKVTRWDLLASNGVVHVTDAVILPPKPDPEKALKKAKPKESEAGEGGES